MMVFLYAWTQRGGQGGLLTPAMISGFLLISPLAVLIPEFTTFWPTDIFDISILYLIGTSPFYTLSLIYVLFFCVLSQKQRPQEVTNDLYHQERPQGLSFRITREYSLLNILGIIYLICKPQHMQAGLLWKQILFLLFTLYLFRRFIFILPKLIWRV